MSGQQRIEALESRVDELHQKVETLEDRVESGGTREADGFDQYDMPVVDTLNPGVTYSSREIHNRYEVHSTITDPEKIRNRTRLLFQRDEFTYVDHGKFKFQP